MFLGQLKQAFGKPKQEGVPEETQKPAATKSASAEEFLQSAKTKAFINKWAKKTGPDGKSLYKKRGISRLLRTIHPSFDSDKEALLEGEEVLKMLGGMDKLEGFLAGWKAKSEGIIKKIVGTK